MVTNSHPVMEVFFAQEAQTMSTGPLITVKSVLVLMLNFQV